MPRRFSAVIGYFLIVSGIILILSSFPPAWAEISPRNSSNIEPYDLASQANQIKLLIGAIVLLFGGNLFWLRKLVNGNDAHHAKHYDEAKKLRHDLDGLVGEHRMSMQIRGCAADPNVMEKTIQNTMTNILREYHLHQRLQDNIVGKRKNDQIITSQEDSQGNLFSGDGTL